MVDQMIRLRELLDEKGIEWTDHSDPDIDRTRFSHKGFQWSVINGLGSYGGFQWFTGKNEGLLELMSNAVNGGDPIGWLTADEVIQMVIER